MACVIQRLEEKNMDFCLGALTKLYIDAMIILLAVYYC